MHLNLIQIPRVKIYLWSYSVSLGTLLLLGSMCVCGRHQRHVAGVLRNHSYSLPYVTVCYRMLQYVMVVYSSVQYTTFTVHYPLDVVLILFFVVLCFLD